MCTAKAIAIVVVLAFCGGAAAQTFESASVKVSAVQTGRGRMKDSPGRIEFTNVTLSDVIRRGYDLMSYQLSAPDWASSRRYDIAAVFPASASRSDCNLSR
jgi:uncharacterized protein (TIGR03435 family)